MSTTDKAKLKSKMVLHGDTQVTAAKALGMSVRALNCKINGRSYFSAPEIILIRERYKLTPEEIMDIFFTNEVS